MAGARDLVRTGWLAGVQREMGMGMGWGWASGCGCMGGRVEGLLFHRGRARCSTTRWTTLYRVHPLLYTLYSVLNDYCDSILYYTLYPPILLLYYSILCYYHSILYTLYSTSLLPTPQSLN